MKKNILLLILGILTISLSAKEIKVLQFNVWHEGTSVTGGFEAIADEIIHTDADVVAFSEIRNYEGRMFIPRLLKALEERGRKYYGQTSGLDVGVVSKYEIADQKEVYNGVLKTLVRVGKQDLLFYTAHLDWRNGSNYLPRGYSSLDWSKLPQPELSVEAILADNLASQRDEAIAAFLKDAEQERKSKKPILLCGDFNEASHLDWQADTKDLREHRGLVINWNTSVSLYRAGFRDTYREIYSNAVDYPGFTFPSDNKDVAVKRLAWGPDADERDRIDFIYFLPDKKLSLRDVFMVGPDTSILRNERVKDEGKDKFILPLGVWPSDHRGVMAVFKLKNTGI